MFSVWLAFIHSLKTSKVANFSIVITLSRAKVLREEQSIPSHRKVLMICLLPKTCCSQSAPPFCIPSFCGCSPVAPSICNWTVLTPASRSPAQFSTETVNKYSRRAAIVQTGLKTQMVRLILCYHFLVVQYTASATLVRLCEVEATSMFFVQPFCLGCFYNSSLLMTNEI